MATISVIIPCYNAGEYIEKTLRALEQQGVGIGTFGLSFNGEDLRNHILLEIPELSWIAVNVSGCRANVQVRERVMPPELIRDKDPANVVARRARQIAEIAEENGQPLTEKPVTLAIHEVADGKLDTTRVQIENMIG